MGVMLFVAGLPVVECVLFCLVIGHDPVGLKLAVVNEELMGSPMCPTESRSGSSEMLGCRFLKQLENRQLQLVSFGLKSI